MVHALARLTYGDYEGCSASVRKSDWGRRQDPRCGELKLLARGYGSSVGSISG